jgi:transposase
MVARGKNFKFLKTSRQGSTLSASRSFIGRALASSFGLSFICYVGQTARASFVRKLVLLCRLIIISPCHGRGLESNNTGVFISLLVNIKIDRQPDFSLPLFVPAAHHAQNNRNLRSPEGGFGPIVPLGGTSCPPDRTASPFTDSPSVTEQYLPPNLASDSTGTPNGYQPSAQAGSASIRDVESVKKTKRSGRLKHADEVSAPADSLNMRGWLGRKPVPKRDETVIPAKLVTEVTQCRCKQCCGACHSTKLKRNGQTKTLFLLHTPSDDRPRRIEYRRQKYLCIVCKHTTLQPVFGVYKGTRMTRQLRRYIARQSLLTTETFSGIAKRVGLSEKTISNVFEKHRKHLEAIREIETPRVMGMDGVYINGQESLIVTDIERKRPVMLRPFIKERAVADALREMPDLDKVEEALADMAGSLDRVQQVVVPKAIRTKDRYHVQRTVNAAVDFVRRELTPGKKKRKKGLMAMCASHILRKRKNQLKDHDRAALDWCLGLYPLLRLTYELKEAYCEFWKSRGVATARLKYDEWLDLHEAWKKVMPEKLQGAFDPLIRLMKNWGEGIFNYFHRRHTNAYTESANARVKELNRKAPNANFTTINTKVIQGTRLKQQREAVRKRGKQQRRAQRSQQLIIQPPGADPGTVLVAPQEGEVPMPTPAPDSTVSTSRKQESCVNVDRPAALKRRSKESGDSGMPSPSQMSLFK